MDTGSAHNRLPTRIFNALAAAYKPAVNTVLPGVAYVVACNATAPAFGLTIGTRTFSMRKEDMITTNPDGTCSPSFLPYDSLVVMGVPFLRSVLVAFYLGNQTMGFASLM